MTMQRQQLITEFEKQIRKLKEEEIDHDTLEQYHQLIKDGIDDDIKTGFKDTIARNLTMGIGLHAGTYPKHLILNNEKDGWKYITRHLLWQQHILQKLFHYKELTSRTVGSIIGLSLLWDMTELAKLSRAYFQLLFDADKGKYEQKEAHHLFVAILYDLRNQSGISNELYLALPIDRPYRHFLDAWNSKDEELLSELLSSIADDHIYSSLDMKNKFAEILSLNFIPYEIRLIQKIRKEQRLPDIKINHPLLHTPLADIPEKTPEWDLLVDDTFQYLIQRE